MADQRDNSGKIENFQYTTCEKCGHLFCTCCGGLITDFQPVHEDDCTTTEEDSSETGSGDLSFVDHDEEIADSESYEEDEE